MGEASVPHTWAGLLAEVPQGPLYLGDEHARLLDSKRVAGVVGAPDDAEPQRASCSWQADLLPRHERA